ncbi:MAG: FAD-dependent oxidoreductase [Leptolyngbya sp. SIO1D8]|nr:FAD-dependent oxidoreductase [Leptolyngbya sp. SIO1D8]
MATTPVVAATAMNEAIAPYLESQQLQLIANSEPEVVLKQEVPGRRRRVVGIRFRHRHSQQRFTVMAQIVIEATDLGDLLALGGLESRVGQESLHETGEAALPTQPHPDCQQPFTWGAIVELMSPRQHQEIAIPLATETDPWRTPEDFTADVWTHASNDRWKRWSFLSPCGIFRYGRCWRSHGYQHPVLPGDVAVIAWATAQSPNLPIRYGNDYRFGSLVGVPSAVREQHLQQARDRTRAYLHFLHTHATPNCQPRGDLTWSDDGLATVPYIREARRGIAMKTIRHEEIAAQFYKSPRAACFSDSVGLGTAPFLDLRQNQAIGHVQLHPQAAQVKPFSLPVGALVPIATDGLILSSKSIGTTHITNAVYRLPTVEWAIGEASGCLAAWALKHGKNPHELITDMALLRQLQGKMTRHGIPIFSFDDVPHDDPDFEPIQMMAVMAVVGSGCEDTLQFCPEVAVSRAMVAVILVKFFNLATMTPVVPTFHDVLPGKHGAYAAVETLYSSGIAEGIGRDRFAPNLPVTRSTFAMWIRKSVPEVYATAFHKIPADATYLRRRELVRVLYKISLSRLRVDPVTQKTILNVNTH